MYTETEIQKLLHTPNHEVNMYFNQYQTSVHVTLKSMLWTSLIITSGDMQLGRLVAVRYLVKKKSE